MNINLIFIAKDNPVLLYCLSSIYNFNPFIKECIFSRFVTFKLIRIYTDLYRYILIKVSSELFFMLNEKFSDIILAVKNNLKKYIFEILLIYLKKWTCKY